MTNEYEVMAEELLKGAYDLHTHSAPSHVGRSLNDFELVREAGEAGMAGVIIKSHYETTMARARIANLFAGSSATAYGAITLNLPVGGLNPYAVQNALDSGAKMVWMPTMDSAHSQRGDSGAFYARKGIRILTEDGKLKDEVYEILDLCREHGVSLATGHVSPEEAKALCREGISRGVRMILTHPEWPKTTLSLKEQLELADMGVIVEKLWLNIAEGSCTAEYMAETLKALGPRRAFLSTDRGQAGHEHPVEGLRKFIISMLMQGIGYEDIRIMTHETPETVLNIT